jgi:hypothetical protein
MTQNCTIHCTMPLVKRGCFVPSRAATSPMTARMSEGLDRTHNAGVAGSSPAPATILPFKTRKLQLCIESRIMRVFLFRTCIDYRCAHESVLHSNTDSL